MAEMGRYCKAYAAEDLRRFPGWKENLDNLRQDRTELKDDDILYLQENFAVTDGIYVDENIIFDDVTEEWKAFCTGEMDFEIPVYEPIEIPRKP